MFITIEGIDGSGKSTQSGNIARWLEQESGVKTVRTFEPGDWYGGQDLRKFILGSKNFCALSELLLFMTDRAEHVNKVILPALRAGHNVVCERYNASTIAYQAGGHNLDIEQVKNIIAACNFPVPDVQILLDIDPETAIARVRHRNNHDDKFEAEGLALLKSVAESYRDIEDLITIDCNNKTENQVFKSVIATLGAVLWPYR